MSFKDSIRSQVILGRSAEIRTLLLTDDQLSLADKVDAGEVTTASQLADKMDISIQNASSKLNRLYVAGYIDRSTRSAESGGIEHVYSVDNHPNSTS